MSDISNKTLALLVGVAIVISVGGIFLAQNGGIQRITGGAVTNQDAYVNLSIESVASIKVTNNISFYNGSVATGFDYATLDSETGTTTQGSWVYPAAQFIQVENDGNVDLNITVMSDKINATDFIGASPGNFNTKFQLKSQDVNAGDCAIAGVFSAYADVNSTEQFICEKLQATSGSNQIKVSAYLEVPRDSSKKNTGELKAVLTFTGTEI